MVIFVAACIARALPSESNPRAIWPIWPALAILAAVLGYGYLRTANNDTTPGARIALIQGSIDSTISGGEEQRDILFTHYLDLSRQAVDKFGQVDLIVWPETYFVCPLVTADEDAGTKDPQLQAEGYTIEQFRERLRLWADAAQEAFRDTAEQLRAFTGRARYLALHRRRRGEI